MVYSQRSSVSFLSDSDNRYTIQRPELSLRALNRFNREHLDRTNTLQSSVLRTLERTRPALRSQ